MGPSNKTEQQAFLALLFLLILGALFVFSPFWKAIVLAIVLAVLFEPLHRKFLHWTGGRPNLAASLSVMAVVLFLLIPFAILFRLLMGQLAGLVASGASPTTQPSVSEFLQGLQGKLTGLGGQLERLLGVKLQIASTVREGLSNLAQAAARYSPQVIAETASFFLNFFVILILLFYLLRDGERLIMGLIRITPVKDRYERRLAAEIQSTIRAVFHGNFIMGLIQGLLATLGYFALGIDGYLVWGVLTFFTSFLPTVGTGAVIVPMIIYLFLQGKSLQAVILFFYGIVLIGTIDNLIRPYLMRQDMHPIFLFLGIFGGLAVFGPIGMLLGPMLMALLVATIRIYAEDFAEVSLPHPPTSKKGRS
jgi:predicted PurR-regulated permease PerM